jgi:hypothetical protein
VHTAACNSADVANGSSFELCIQIKRTCCAQQAKQEPTEAQCVCEHGLPPSQQTGKRSDKKIGYKVTVFGPSATIVSSLAVALSLWLTYSPCTHNNNNKVELFKSASRLISCCISAIERVLYSVACLQSRWLARSTMLATLAA